jgi:hypothetical protein
VAGAFLGEQLHAEMMRAFEEGELQRILALPWGIGAIIRQTAATVGRSRAGVFFATRTRAMPGAPDGYRYWRFLEHEPIPTRTASSATTCRSFARSTPSVANAPTFPNPFPTLSMQHELQAP